MIRFKKHYPNILFVKSDDADISELRHELSGAGIYIHTSSFADAKDSVKDADMLVILSPDYSSDAVSLINYAADNAGARMLYIGRDDDVPQDCPAEITVIANVQSSIISEISRIFKETFTFDPICSEDDEIVCELSKPPQVFYNGTKLMLSKSESKIIHFLLTVEPKVLVPKETIGEYLALAAGAIPVHIHNINDKSMKSYHDKLVFSRSGRGYFVY